MNVILYMAMTANGYIATEQEDAPWSQEIWDAYYDFISKKGNIIVGRRTYEMMEATGNEFQKLGNPTVIIVSRWLKEQDNHNTTIVASPREALEALEQKGFKEAVVGGGSMLNAGFLKDGLIDEIYLDIEPRIFGKGIRLFSEIDADVKLELLEMKTLSPHIVRLHYQTKKERA